VIQNYLAESEKVRTKGTVLGKMALRSLVSETMQTFHLVGQVTGWSKSATYQMFTQMITGVISMISTMTLAASSAVATYGPVVGPWIAAWNIGNSIAAFGLQTSLQTQQSAMSTSNDYISGLMESYKND
jgi:hypothetical protein